MGLNPVACTGRCGARGYLIGMPSNNGPGGVRGAIMREIGARVLGQVKHALTERNQLTRPERDALHEAKEPPVVAQLMIEIRSDGTRTIARGALNDLLNEENAQIHAEGRTPTELMASLASSLLSLPATILRAPRAKAPKPSQIELPASMPAIPRKKDE